MKKVNPIKEKFLTILMFFAVNGGLSVWEFAMLIVGESGKKKSIF